MEGFNVLELVLDARMLGDPEVDGRNREEEGDFELFGVVDKVVKIELGHPVHDAAFCDFVNEVALQTGNVSGWQMSNGASVVRVSFSSPFLADWTTENGGQVTLGDEVLVGDADA